MLLKILKDGYTLKQLMEVYNKGTLSIQIPESLRDERVFIYGDLYTAVKYKEAWVDKAISDYLESSELLSDLEEADKEWQERRLEFNDYWLQLECDRDKKIHIIVDMDLKVF